MVHDMDWPLETLSLMKKYVFILLLRLVEMKIGLRFICKVFIMYVA